MFVSIPGTLAPQTITLDEAVALIEEKRSKEANRLIKAFDELPGVEVLNGRFGPYIALHKEGQRKSVNYKIPKGTDPASLTADRVKGDNGGPGRGPENSQTSQIGKVTEP